MRVAIADLREDHISRLLDGLAFGGRIIFSHWDLDIHEELAFALGGVQVIGSYQAPISVVAPANRELFDVVESVPLRLTFNDLLDDDGDRIAIDADADDELVASYDDLGRTGAAALTNARTSLVFGFLPVGLVFNGPRDADEDGIADVEELYVNALQLVCSAP